MLINAHKASQICGMQLRGPKGEPYWTTNVRGKPVVDTDHPAWIKFVNSPKCKKQRDKKEKKAAEKINKKAGAIKEAPALQEEDEVIEGEATEKQTRSYDLANRAGVADLQDVIFSAKIKEERAKQEEIKTLELKKELAPFDLVKYFFSFSENLMHRSFRRCHEIIPELNALFVAGKLQDAEQFLIREQETIVKEAQTELIKAIKEEGYEYEER